MMDLEFGFARGPSPCPPPLNQNKPHKINSLGKQDRDILEGLDVALALREPPMGDCGVLGVEIEV